MLNFHRDGKSGFFINFLYFFQVLINIIAADLLCVGIDAFIIIVAVRIVRYVADGLRGGSYRLVGITVTITIEIIIVGLQTFIYLPVTIVVYAVIEL